MEREQNFLFNKDTTEIPNIYFSKNGNYSTSSPSNDMNPNIIEGQCKNNNFDTGIQTSISTDDTEYAKYINNNSNFNNFIYKYATGDVDTSSYTKPVKNQLDYLSCQLLKNKNKSFDTSNYSLTNSNFFQNAGPIVLALIVVGWLMFSYFKFIFKDGRFHKNFNVKSGVSWWEILLMIIIVCGIVSSLSLLLGNVNTDTDTSNNILFYESLSKENLQYNIEKYIGLAKGGFIALLCLIFIIYFMKCTESFKNINGNIFFGIITFILIVGVTLLFIYNNLDTQYITAESNEYNTTKNIYQNLLDGVGNNFGYIITLLLLSVISYVAYLALKGKNGKTEVFFRILFSSFAFMLPLLITVFEGSFAMLYPIPFLLSIIVLRGVLYMITYMLPKTDKMKNAFSVIYELPVEYFENMIKGTTIQGDYPKTNPSGMPWNLLSVGIIKIIILICNLIPGIDTSDTYFNRMLPEKTQKGGTYTYNNASKSSTSNINFLNLSFFINYIIKKIKKTKNN